MSCTTLLVGKNASYDGSTMIARNDDSGADGFTPKKFVVISSKEQKRKYKKKQYNHKLRYYDLNKRVMMGDSEDNLDFVREVSDDYAILVPAGKWHNIVNTGDKPLKIYSIYAPAEHPHGTVHKTRQEAMEAEHHH